MIGQEDFDKKITAALAGLGTIVVVQLVQLESIDRPLEVALYCFAISIPMLAAHWFLVSAKAESSIHIYEWSAMIALGLGGVGAVFGLLAIFMHFSIALGGTFVASLVVGSCLFLIGTRERF